MKYITIEHWERHQHYKDRRPPWIKLEIEIIEEFDADGNFKKFHPMPDDAKLTFICLLCLRANFNGKIPFKNETWLKNKLGIKRINLQPLVIAGYISIDSNSVAEPAQKCSTSAKSDTAESETEGERESETETELAPKIGACPYLEIIKIYHEKLSSLPAVKSLSENLKRTVRSRWKEHPTLEWFEWYFNGISECDYLMGKVKDWAADFTWLVGPKNMTKVLNGAYLSRKGKREADAINEFLGENQP